MSRTCSSSSSSIQQPELKKKKQARKAPRAPEEIDPFFEPVAKRLRSRSQSRPRDRRLSSSSSTSSYASARSALAPTVEETEGTPPTEEEIPDSLAYLDAPPLSPAPVTSSAEALSRRRQRNFDVVIEKIPGFDRSQYTSYNSDPESHPPIQAEPPSVPPPPPPTPQIPPPQPQPQQQQIIVESFTKVSQIERSSQSVLLVYEESVLVPASQIVTPASSGTKPGEGEEGPGSTIIPETPQQQQQKQKQPAAGHNNPRKKKKPHIASGQEGPTTLPPPPPPPQILLEAQLLLLRTPALANTQSQSASGATAIPAAPAISKEHIKAIKAPAPQHPKHSEVVEAAVQQPARISTAATTTSTTAATASTSVNRDPPALATNGSGPPKVLAATATATATAVATAVATDQTPPPPPPGPTAPPNHPTTDLQPAHPLPAPAPPPISAFSSWFTNREPRPAPKVSKQRRRKAAVVAPQNNGDNAAEDMSGAQSLLLRERLAKRREERNAKILTARSARSQFSPVPPATPPTPAAAALPASSTPPPPPPQQQPNLATSGTAAGNGLGDVAPGSLGVTTPVESVAVKEEASADDVHINLAVIEDAPPPPPVQVAQDVEIQDVEIQDAEIQSIEIEVQPQPQLEPQLEEPQLQPQLEPEPQPQPQQPAPQTKMQSPFRTPYLGPAEYAIGLPLRTKTVTPKAIDQKTAYLISITEKHGEIKRYLSNPHGADAALVDAMQEILANTGKIATHPDLLMKKIEVSDAAAGKEADYHAAMSSKFVFLRAFLVAVRQQHLKIVIVAERGKIIDILEIFLRGIRIAYTRLDQLSTLPKIPHDDNEGLVRVFLLPSSKSGSVVNVADCLIAMDSSFDATLPEVHKCRSNSYEVGKLAPVFRLVAINSIEHLRLCSPPGQEVPLYVYIETLKNLRQQVGVATQDYGSAVSRAPTKITKWLQKKAEGKLEIPEIPELPLFEITSHAQPTTPNTSTSTTNNSSGNEGCDKRKRQETQTVVSPQQDAKRTRVNDPEPMGPIPEFVECLTPHVVGDVTHVSDSMPSQAPTDQSSVLGHTDNEGHRTLAESVAMDISEGDQTAVEDNKTDHVVTAIEIEDSMDHTATAEKQVEEQVEMQVEEQVEEQVEMQVEVQVEVQVEEKVVEGEQEEEEEEAEDIPKDNPVTFPEISSTNGLNIESLSREQLVAAFKRQAEGLQQWMESAGRLQLRHDELKKQLADTRKELRRSQKTQRDAENRKEHTSKELAKVRNERNKADEELKDARARLLAGPPDKAALEQSRAENEKLSEKLRTVECKLQAQNNDFEFLRGQYQEASNGALELNADNTRLQEENSVLERRGADVVVQLRRMQHESQVQARDKQIESLTLQLREREERIARLEHERQVNTRTRGSIGMRASSVSIRGSPIQSRATSPATGPGTYGRESSSTHPLRNG
ncbi:hypothetical protein P167DRAFT_605614 [Morchella conica CCBAS932]|uniref:HDA1 complex subunit n=1 Tax=Morchella conica CCBAS932 TaxID=1392247 RepID=A0A3N4KSG1_9PEZI|nr:hypothetical protein P167DRAFT_605614 [Morchella conica CCBAS932]